MLKKLKLNGSMMSYKTYNIKNNNNNNNKKKNSVLFIIRVWNVKVGSQEIPGVFFGLRVENEAGQRLTEFFQENTLVIANTLFQQHKRRLYTWTSPDAQYRNQIGYILCS